MTTTTSIYVPTSLDVKVTRFSIMKDGYILEFKCNETAEIRFVGLRYHDLIELLDKLNTAMLSVELPTSLEEPNTHE